MQPSVLNFLLVSGVVLFLLTVYMIWRRPKRAPSQLKLRESAKQDKSGLARQKPQLQVERQLNVIFQFNGHSFDAHEVLGVSAGCALEVVERGYRKSLAQSDKDAHEFFRLAYEAIKLTRL